MEAAAAPDQNGRLQSVINFMLRRILSENIYILNKGKVLTPFIHKA